jgi:D-alanyl-lipoteichoic acid acyltransferase DltB (MBOAT superfamily)
MLFNSYEFVLIFLPITIVLFVVCGRLLGKRAAFGSLVVASLVFYARWNPPYLLLVISSTLFNYAMGSLQHSVIRRRGKASKGLLAFGVAANLALLAYFKYANFFVHTVAKATGSAWHIEAIILPLAISFFTFTQIAYLVDVWEGMVCSYSFLDYCFFVLFFPHLIAGPIVRHHEILPQVHESDGLLNFENLAVGLTVLAMGLFKKVVFADSIAQHATAVFSQAQAGVAPNFLAAWGGVLAYACQIYFDFSGYSDMAIGLGCIFGIRMPLNFNSPYKARSIIDFWRRWHMSLSRFLRDYLYIRLGGNRKGVARRYTNLMVTMLLGGLWHGAGWTFVIWGGLHGLYLLVNHAWIRVTKGQSWADSRPMLWVYHLATFVAVLIGWVFFRAKSFTVAVSVLKGMVGLNGISLNPGLGRLLGHWATHLPITFAHSGFSFNGIVWLLILLPILFLMPNTQEIMYRVRPALKQAEAAAAIMWRPSQRWALLTGLVLAIALLKMGRVTEFLYFQF